MTGGEKSAADLVNRMLDPAARTPEIIDRYYTLCIPYYRGFLGDHWHTGFYLPDDQPIGRDDQLRMEERIAESAGLGPDSRVLDVGCGVGGTACHLARRTGARVRGLTPNRAQLEIARQSTAAHRLRDRVLFDLGSADRFPYPDDSFDAVLFFESACHFPDRERFFREVRRTLRPGGRLAGEDWLAVDDLSPAKIARYIGPICRAWAIPSLGTRSEYAAAMAAAGLTVRDAIDLRSEMPLARGFLIDETARRDARAERDRTSDPIGRLIMEGLLLLGEAVAAGAFTLGRFLAVK